MGHNYRHIRKVNGHIIKIHGIRVLEMYATSTAHTSTDARMSCMEDCWQPGFRDHLIEEVRTAIVRVERLHRWVKFEASHAVVLNEAAGLARSHFPLGWIDAGKWNEYISVLS